MKQRKRTIKSARTTLKEDAGKILLDLGKLVFGGIFLSGLLRGGTVYDTLVTGGFAAAIVLMVAGFPLGIKKKNGESSQASLRPTSRRAIRRQKRRKI